MDCFISLPTTSPLRKKIDIEKSIRMFEENLYDIVITASESSRNPSFNMVKINSKNEASLLLPHKNKIMNRQQASKTYDVGTSAYVADPNFILNNESIFDGKVGVLIIPKKRSIDIDDLIDFKIAEFLKLKNFKLMEIAKLLDFSNKTTLITGATGNLGVQLSKNFANLGSDLILVDLYKNKLKKLSRELSEQTNSKINYFACDLGNENARKNLYPV